MRQEWRNMRHRNMRHRRRKLTIWQMTLITVALGFLTGLIISVIGWVDIYPGQIDWRAMHGEARYRATYHPHNEHQQN